MPSEPGFRSSPDEGKNTSRGSSAPISALNITSPAIVAAAMALAFFIRGLRGRQWLGVLHLVRDHARELSALQQFAAFAAAAGDLVFGGADRLLAAAARFNPHQIAIARRGDEAENMVLLRLQFDEDHSFAWPGQVIHLVGAAQDRARVVGGGNHDFSARDLRDADNFHSIGRPRVAPAGAGARFDE